MEELRIEEMKEEFNSEYHKGDFAEPPFYNEKNIGEPVYEELPRDDMKRASGEIPKPDKNMKEKEMKEEKKQDDMYTLIKPFYFEEKYIERVRIDLDSLTGRDLKKALRDTTSPNTTIAEHDKEYLANVACIAMGVPYEFMDYIGAQDFTFITHGVYSFFLGSFLD